MKATLKFKLPQEKEEFNHALNGIYYIKVLHDLDQKLRNMWKYENIETVSIDDIRTWIRELINDEIYSDYIL